MQRKLLETISVDFDTTGQLTTDHICYIHHIHEKKMGKQRSSASAIYRLKASL
jgi:hypothetical protein